MVRLVSSNPACLHLSRQAQAAPFNGEKYGDANGWIRRGCPDEARACNSPKLNTSEPSSKPGRIHDALRNLTGQTRSGGLITVFDVEKRSLRKFNLTTLVGRLTAFAPGAQPSFCA
jgi:hypothetical protein